MKKALLKLKAFLYRFRDERHHQQLKITATKEGSTIQALMEEALDFYPKTRFRDEVQS